MILTNQMLLMAVIAGAIFYVAYSCYLIKKKKCQIDEDQERRVAKYILLVIFFVLSMIYQNSHGSCIFMVIWFGYALYLVSGETKRTLSCDRRRSSDCFQC